MSSSLKTKPPPPSSSFRLEYPSPSILLITITRPSARNALTLADHWTAHSIFSWFDAEPSLAVAIVTGEGEKAFCAGQDLKEQGTIARDDPIRRVGLPQSGFMGLSLRTGRKPVIAAVNGVAVGGGFEIVLNCDIVLAAPHATFGLPEALRGLYAGAGGLPHLTRTVGLQVASELALTGRTIAASEARDLRVINRITASAASLLPEALDMAARIASCSPDAVIVTRAGIRDSLETGSTHRSWQLTAERFNEKLFGGENFGIGVRAFAAREVPKWVPSKL